VCLENNRVRAVASNKPDSTRSDMRVLVVGPSTSINASLACHVLRTLKSECSGVVWNVITSYQTSLDLYQACPNVSSVTAFKDIKEDETDQGQGLLIEVLASSFFEKSWVKQRLREGTDLVVVSASPVTLMDKSILETFDRVYMTKTAAADKQSQYYTLFVDTSKQTFGDFKKLIKGMATNQYARVNMTRGRAGQIEVETYVAVWEQPSGSASSVPTVSAAAVPLAKPPSVTVDRPPEAEAVVNTNRVELWLCMTAAPKVALDDVVINLKTMLGNELIASMLHQSLYSKDDSTRRVDVYLQVFEQRQDLLASLVFNILQSLRGAGIIAQGCIAV